MNPAAQAVFGSATRIAAASIAVAIAVLALKAVAAWLSGSVALLSDAVESIVGLVLTKQSSRSEPMVPPLESNV